MNLARLNLESLRIRHPVVDDHARVLAVMDAWWGDLGGAAGSQQRALLLPRLFFQHFTDSSFVVEQPDGRLVAFLIGFRSQSQLDVAYIHFVGVDPDLRRAGLGRTLYLRFFDLVSRRGARTVRCITGPINTQSVRFHTALGFTLDDGDSIVNGVPVQPNYDGPGLDRVAFTRRLEPAESDLTTLIREMSPRLNNGAYVFACVTGSIPDGLEPCAVIREDDGTTLIVPQQQADSHGIEYAFVAAWITLEIQSALDAVGLTAAISVALAAAGISANVVAGFHHDHIFVPVERGAEAVQILAELAART